MSYIVPVHRPSGVRFAVKLNFLSPDEEALIVGKANRLEIYSFSHTDGLTLVHSRSVYGYISMLSGLRLANSSTDHLFVGTDRYQYFTCSWDAETKSLKTEQSMVDQADKTMRDTKELDRVHIDPTGRYMTLELFDGVVTILPIVQQTNKRIKKSTSAGAPARESGTLDDPIQVRTEETLTRDSAFLEVSSDSTANPILAILWDDNNDVPQLKLRELKHSPKLSPGEADLVTTAELRAELDLGVSHLIPVSAPYGGWLILGETSISYVDRHLSKIQTQPLEDSATIWSCWTKVDETRWLLADDYGRLYFLMIESANVGVTGWRIDSLGDASNASCLVYLDAGIVFVGSHSGDSQLVQIVEEGVQVLQTFSNIAPILDFSIMDLGRGSEGTQVGDFSSGQARIVTASGAWQDGTIRSVRSGVGITELGVIGEIPLINDMWALSSTGLDATQDILLTTSYEESRVFKFDAEANIEETADFYTFDLSDRTILATNLPDRKLLHITRSNLRIIDLESGMEIFQWKPPETAMEITSASANGAHVAVVQGGLVLHVFHLSHLTTSEPSSKTFPSETQISNVTLPDSQSDTCILSFWQTASISIVDLHGSLDVVSTQSVGEPGKDVPRSLLLAHVLPDSLPSLFVAMMDGSVVTFSFDSGKRALSGMTRIMLGTEPVVFKPLPRVMGSDRELVNVFASCEQPSLIYASEGRMIYSAVNTEKSSRVCSFNSEAFPGAVALASPSELRLATIGTARTTQLQTLSVGETVRCVAYKPEAKIFGMGCVRRIMESGTEALLSSVKIADELSFKELDSVELSDNELVECIISLPPNDDEGELAPAMFVVGTSLAIENDQGTAPEERGRILVYQVEPKRNKLKIVAQVEVRGACRSLALCDAHIVAGLVKVVVLYNLIPAKERGGKFPYELDRLATYRTSTNPMSLSVQPSTPDTAATIAVADLMKSISIISVIGPETAGRWQLKEVGRHFATVWSSSTAVIADGEYLLADMEGNLLTLRRNTDAVTYDERIKLEVTGEMRLGEVVNRIVPIRAIVPQDEVTGTGKGKERSRTMSSAAEVPEPKTKNLRASRTGALIQPQAFVATVEGSIYMLGAINPAYTDALLRLQNALASRIEALGYMPWPRYRAWKTDVREADEPFRFVDGEMVESGLLNLTATELEAVMKEHGLTDSVSAGGLEMTVDEVRAWGEELRRLY